VKGAEVVGADVGNNEGVFAERWLRGGGHRAVVVKGAVVCVGKLESWERGDRDVGVRGSVESMGAWSPLELREPWERGVRWSRWSFLEPWERRRLREAPPLGCVAGSADPRCWRGKLAAPEQRCGRQSARSGSKRQEENRGGRQGRRRRCKAQLRGWLR
jgi:hypothetical protein